MANELNTYIKELPGYKIANTHFRLGSKIHISQFYYAKRFFQNSFFASRFAFLIAREILTTHKDKRADFKEKGLTLIGYGLYSELLLSLVVQFLKKALPTDEINHNLISDAEEPSFIKKDGDRHDHIVIIVPIASTFSTAIKIRNTLLKKWGNNLNILEPYINVLHVDHSPSNGETPNGNGLFSIEKKFGWTAQGENTVTINSSGPTVQQKFFLALPSEWYDVINCGLCFPQEHEDERPLYQTDKTSVTPTLIFEKPAAREVKGGEKFDLKPETLQYGHVKRGDKHFHYYIQVEKFLKENLNGVKEWLNGIKKGNGFKLSFKETNRVIIAAPGHYSNTGFIHLVNEILFSNAATILHFNTENDHVLNFGLLFGKELQKEDTRVVFVDDTITTGSAFRSVGFFVEKNRGNHSRPAFDACIILLDRSNRFVHEQVKARTGAYFSFANLHLPGAKDFEGRCALDMEYQRYSELASHAFLTRMKIHFLAQRDKLQARTTTQAGGKKGERYVRQVEAIHRIYEWSKNPAHDFYAFDTFHKWREDLLANTESPFSQARLKETTSPNGLSNETTALLKVLSHSPFIHYKPIRDNLFRWVLELLKKQIKTVRDRLGKGAFNYDAFRDLKFLLRRAGILNTNYLISKEIFDFIKELYGPNGLPKLEQDKRSEIKALPTSPQSNTSNSTASQAPNLFAPTQASSNTSSSPPTSLQTNKTKDELECELENIRDFHVFYTAQIKELLHRNEARSIRLEKTLLALKKPNGKSQNGLSAPYEQFIRFIREENGILILRFWDFIRGRLADITYQDLFNNNTIADKLEDAAVTAHYRAKVLEEFLSLQSASTNGGFSLTADPHLPNFLKLMHFLEIEQREKDLPLSAKTDFLIERLKDFIRAAHPGSKELGAFFFVRYKQGAPPFLAYNSGTWGGLNKDALLENKHLKSFFKPKSNDKSAKTIIEFHKDEHGQWTDLYSTDSSNTTSYQFDFLPEKCNRLLLVKYNKLKVDVDNVDSSNFSERLTDEEQAIVGFYFHTNSSSSDITDVWTTRYLLLSRAPISAFIEKHHENDEFRDWVEADNRKRIELLTGHGRDMLIDIAISKREYRGIINTILLSQMFMINLEEAFNLNPDGRRGTGKTVTDVFNKLFKPTNSSQVDKAYLAKLQKMAGKIFDMEEIENKAGVKVLLNNGIGSSSFPFPTDILDMICFELFVNAKKNRWIFLNGETIQCEDKKYQTNEIEITAKELSDKLELTISNTCPGDGVELPETIRKLRNGEPKGYKSVAGLNMIKKLLSVFNLGSIDFNAQAICGHFYKFSVTLTLNAWNNGMQSNGNQSGGNQSG